MGVLLILLASFPGCMAVSDTDSVILVGSPTLGLPETSQVGGAMLLSLITATETRLCFELEREGETRRQDFDAWARIHEVPVLGLRPDSEYTLTVTLTGHEGTPLTLDPIYFVSGSLPERFPTVELLAHKPDQMEPGYRLMTFKRPTDSSVMLVAFDREMEPVWWSEGTGWGDVGFSPRGTLVGLVNGTAEEMDLLGQTLRTWKDGVGLGSEVSIPYEHLHHELVEVQDELFLSLGYYSTEVEAYPESYSNPEVLSGPVEVKDSHVVLFDAEGQEQENLALVDVLDTTRIGYDSLDNTGEGEDWVHANAVVPAPDSDRWVVSSRHQGAVFEVAASGALSWILADPQGWSEAWQPFLLEAVGEPFRWPYHQHSVTHDDQGLVWMFDNGSHGCTPYSSDCPGEVTSRAVAYEIDPAAGTVRQVWQLEDTTTGPLYAPALGDADPLPETGNVLIDFGRLEGEGEVSNLENGLGSLSARLLEVNPEHDDIVLDVRFSAPYEEEEEGYISYRVEWLPGFYP